MVVLQLLFIIYLLHPTEFFLFFYYLKTPDWSQSDTCEKCLQPFFWNFKHMWENKVVGVRQVRGKAKTKIQTRYPFLGGGTYQLPVLSVLYLQVGY